MLHCTRCEGTGFLNTEQIPDGLLDKGVEAVLSWLETCRYAIENYPCTCHLVPPCPTCVDYVNDVQVCDCCGDGDNWYGEPGNHYSNEDPRGPDGPYADNGGLCQCH